MANGKDNDTAVCHLDIHKEIWDLEGDLEAKWYNKATGEPVHVVHDDQDSVVKVRLTLYGKILNYLCDTEICVTLAFESCGSGNEFERSKWKTVKPCDEGGNVIEFEFDIEAGTLYAGECGKQYRMCITLGSRDCCGKSGFIYGTCHDLDISVLPADVNN